MKSIDKQTNVIVLRGEFPLNATILSRHYDVLLNVDTATEYQKREYERLKRLMHFDAEYETDDYRRTASDIQEYSLPDCLFNIQGITEEEKNKAWRDFDDALYLIDKENEGVFSLKYFKEHKYKERIHDFFNFVFWGDFVLELHKSIDGKDIIVLDGEPEEGKEWSSRADMIWRMFDPHSVTIIRTPLSQKEI